MKLLYATLWTALATVSALPSPALAQAAIVCNPGDPACRQMQRRFDADDVRVLPRSVIEDRRRDGVVVLPRRSSREDRQRRFQPAPCDNGTVIRGSGTRVVPTC